MHERFLRFELERPKKADKDASIEKILNTMLQLQKLDLVFENWYSTDRPKKGKGYEKIELSIEYLTKMYNNFFIKNKNSTSINDIECGISKDFKNSSNYQKSFILSFNLDGTSIYVNNVVVFYFPDFIEESKIYLIEDDSVEKIVSLFKEIWNPIEIFDNIK